MEKLRVPFMDLQRVHAPIKAELDQAIQKVIAHSSFILGEELGEFEQAYAAYIGTDYCIGINSGLDGLRLLIEGLLGKDGGEILVPAHTYIATWLSIIQAGFTPIAVDLSPNSYLSEAETFEGKIGPQTKAIVPVHLYGQALDMDEILRLAQRYDLVVIEDNAQAHGAKFQDRRTGSFGHAAAHSFYPGKNLGAFGDAGAITTNDKQLYKRLLALRNYGSIKKYEHEMLGYSSRMDCLQAAILNVKLQHLDQWNQERKDIAEFYLTELSGLPITLPQEDTTEAHVWHQFVVRTSKRDELKHHLEQKGIGTLIHYPKLPYQQNAIKNYLDIRYACPRAEKLVEECISLPIYPCLSELEQAYVVKQTKDFFSS